MPDPRPTEQGSGSNPHPHDYPSDSFLWATTGTPENRNWRLKFVVLNLDLQVWRSGFLPILILFSIFFFLFLFLKHLLFFPSKPFTEVFYFYNNFHFKELFWIILMSFSLISLSILFFFYRWNPISSFSKRIFFFKRKVFYFSILSLCSEGFGVFFYLFWILAFTWRLTSNISVDSWLYLHF